MYLRSADILTRLYFFLFLVCEISFSIPTKLTNSWGTSTSELTINEAVSNQQRRKEYHTQIGQWKPRKRYLQQSLTAFLNVSSPLKRKNWVILSSMTISGIRIDTFVLQTSLNVKVYGNCYSPSNLSKPIAGILLPHDHSDRGRFDRTISVLGMVLARSGASVVCWDMIGWGDTLGNHDLSDTKQKQIQIGLEILEVFTHQNHIDSKRIGLVGFSGGANLGLFLTSLTPKIKVRVLASMISALRMGNCSCELLGYPYQQVSVGTDNVELSAVFAPNPQLIISNGQDWTRHFPQIGLKTLQKIYSLYNQPANLQSLHLPNHGHQFSKTHRQASYTFLEKYLNLSFERNEKGEVEESWVPEITEEMLRAPR